MAYELERAFASPVADLLTDRVRPAYTVHVLTGSRYLLHGPA